MGDTVQGPRPLPFTLTDDEIVTERAFGRRTSLAELSLVVVDGSGGVLEPQDDADNE